MKREKVRRMIRKLEKSRMPKKRMKVEIMHALKTIFSILLIIASSVLILVLNNWLEKRLPNDATWSAAFIALPIAFFAILVSIHIALVQKESAIFCSEITVGALRRKTFFWYDLRVGCCVGFFLRLTLWVLTFVGIQDETKYAQLLSCSIIMIIDCIYLIVTDFVFYMIPVEELFVKAFLGDYNYVDRILDNNGGVDSVIKHAAVQQGEDFDSFYLLWETLHIESMKSFNSVVLSIQSHIATDCQKEALILLFRRMADRKVKINDISLICYLVKTGKNLFFDSLDNQNYCFAYQILNALFDLYVKKMSQITKTSKKIAQSTKKMRQSIELTRNETIQMLGMLKKCIVDLLVSLKGMREFINCIECCLDKHEKDVERVPETLSFLVSTRKEVVAGYKDDCDSTIEGLQQSYELINKIMESKATTDNSEKEVGSGQDLTLHQSERGDL